MRFVTPDVVRIPLKDGADGTKNWIEVKKELTVGEEKRFRTMGFKQMTPSSGGEQSDKGGDPTDAKIDVDWARLALARVETYLQDWSATKTVKDKVVPVPVTRSAIEQLAEEDFDEIDKAIQAHIKEQEDAKKATTGEHRPVLTSA
jgi:hypothetical protein